jgi:hypothetical protein
MLYKRQKISFEIDDYKKCVDGNILSKDVIGWMARLDGIRYGRVVLICCSTGCVGIDLMTENNVMGRKVLWEFISRPKVVWIRYNGQMVRNGKMIERYDDILVTRNFHSFFQTEHCVADKVHRMVTHNNTNFGTKIFLGGEMYYYGLVLRKYYEYGYFFSDFDSIVDDTMTNMRYLMGIKKIIVRKINYTTYRTDQIMRDESISVIANNGKNGLGKNIVGWLYLLGVDRITVVSCCPKSFKRDYDDLNKVGSTRYSIDKEHRIVELGGFSISVYVLLKNKEH